MADYSKIIQDLERLHYEYGRSISVTKHLIPAHIATLLSDLPNDVQIELRQFDPIQNVSQRIVEIIVWLQNASSKPAAMVAKSNTVFMVSPFSNPDVNGALGLVFEPIFENLGFLCIRLNIDPYVGDFVDEVIRAIADSALVIVDLTDSRPNCYFEYGLARGFGKIVIPIAKQGTDLASDVRNENTVFYDDLEELKAKMERYIPQLLARYKIHPY